MAKKYKKIVIIGSNSFSAGSLIKILLKKKYYIYGISRSKINRKPFKSFSINKNFRFFRLDINKNNAAIINLIKKIKPNYIINYASQSMVGQSWKDTEDWYLTNSYSMIKLYNGIFNNLYKSRLIHISTPEVYGSIKKNTVENNNYNPTTPYAASRVTADHFLDLLYKFKKINYCSVRASNVYGEYQRLYRIIPLSVYSILKNKKINLHGGGVSKRNFVYIDDVSKAIEIIMKKGKRGETYHISGDEMISIKNLVKKICYKMKYDFNKLVINSNDRKGKDMYYSIKSDKLRNKFGWITKISLDEGLDRCIEWVKKDLNFFKKNDEKYKHIK